VFCGFSLYVVVGAVLLTAVGVMSANGSDVVKLAAACEC
jgi:hypothetical protein